MPIHHALIHRTQAVKIKRALLHLAAVEWGGGRGMHILSCRALPTSALDIYMNVQLQALADQELVKRPTEHTGQRAGWILRAAEGSWESTPPPEIKLPNPRSARPWPTHCTVWAFPPPMTRSDFREILFQRKENIHSKASLRAVRGR